MSLPVGVVMSLPGEAGDTGGREEDEEVMVTLTIGVAMIPKSVSLKVNSGAEVKVCSFCFFNKIGTVFPPDRIKMQHYPYRELLFVCYFNITHINSKTLSLLYFDNYY